MIDSWLISGESNSVRRDGWFSIFESHPLKNVHFLNSSVGSSGIFNTINNIFKYDSFLIEGRGIIIDSFINDYVFFKNNLNIYKQLLYFVFGFLRSRRVVIVYLLFQQSNLHPYGDNFKSFLINILREWQIVIFDASMVFSCGPYSLDALYIDNSHPSNILASEIGHKFRDFLKKNEFNIPNVGFAYPKIWSVDVSYLKSKDVGVATRHVKNSLVSSDVFILREDYHSKLVIPIHFSKSLLVGVIFNAPHSSGVVTFFSNAVEYNLSFNNRYSMRFQSSPASFELMWARPVAHNFFVAGELLLSLSGLLEVNQTIDNDFIGSKELKRCVEIERLIFISYE